MTYDLARWDGKTYKVDLPEGTTEIAGVIVSGDEILVWPTYCDPWEDERVEDFYEGGWRKTLKDGTGWKNERPFVFLRKMTTFAMVVWQHIRCIKIGRPGTPVPGLFLCSFCLYFV